MKKTFLSSVLDALFPPRCPGCSSISSSLCEDCEFIWLSLPEASCSRCARPFEDETSRAHLCGSCLSSPPFFGAIYAAGLYEGLLHDLVVRLKYQSDENLAHFLGERMAAVLPAAKFYDCVIPVPLTLKRLRERDYNQAALLARRVAGIREWRTDVFSLGKIRETPSQVMLSREERRKNLKNAFFVQKNSVLKDKKILVVDDVFTTGATMDEVAKTLLKAGAASVDGLVLARSIL